MQATVVTVNINTNTSVNRCLHGTNSDGEGGTIQKGELHMQTL